MFGFLLLLGFVWSVESQCGHGNHPPCTTASPAEVDHAIVDLSLHYNNDMCLELLLIDCAKHVTQGDEIVCASNGKTYDNHCRFIHARCEYYLIGHKLDIIKIHSGPCITTTAMPSGNTAGSGTTMPPVGAVSTTMAAIMTAGTASTIAAIMTAATAAPAVTTALPVTTVLPTGPTTTGINNLIQQLFCRNVDSVMCSQDFSIVCGTDGQFYPNSCELSKAKCKDLALTVEPDATKCTAPGGK